MVGGVPKPSRPDFMQTPSSPLRMSKCSTRAWRHESRLTPSVLPMRLTGARMAKWAMWMCWVYDGVRVQNGEFCSVSGVLALAPSTRKPSTSCASMSFGRLATSQYAESLCGG
jgi:hypothetical protein